MWYIGSIKNIINYLSCLCCFRSMMQPPPRFNHWHHVFSIMCMFISVMGDAWHAFRFRFSFARKFQTKLALQPPKYIVYILSYQSHYRPPVSGPAHRTSSDPSRCDASGKNWRHPPLRSGTENRSSASDWDQTGHRAVQNNVDSACKKRYKFPFSIRFLFFFLLLLYRYRNKAGFKCQMSFRFRLHLSFLLAVYTQRVKWCNVRDTSV